jgi:predicted dehydrogenase
VALCDVDPKILSEKDNINVFATTDAREIMDRDDVDVVSIATSNHWHAPLTILACQAGKDVYVEKPVSHTVEEGQLMIAAAKKYNRIVQAGTQSRSCTGLTPAVEYVHRGGIGKIEYIHALSFAARPSIGKVAPWKPDWLDYDMYCGPSPNVPLTRTNLHYDWHWMWDTGNGDLANLGVHNVDVARWFLKSRELPRRVMSLGQRYLLNDAGQTPNTQLTLFDFAEAPVIMENRDLPMRTGVKAADSFRGIRSGVIVQCENGSFVGDRGGGVIYDKDGKRLKKFSGDGGGGHQQNFIDAVRSRKTSDLNAPITTGHISTSSCHFGNVSYRLGKSASPDQIKKQIADHAQGAETLARIEKHLAANDIDLSANPLTLGPWLDINTQTQKITAVSGNKDKQVMEKAAKIMKPNSRKPYAIGGK